MLARLLAPLAMGARDVAPTLARLGGALAVTGLWSGLLRALGGQLMQRSTQYEVARRLLAAAGSMQGRVALQVRCAAEHVRSVHMPAGAGERAQVGAPEAVRQLGS